MDSILVIPARAGSTDRKNHFPLGGKPLFRWVLDTALDFRDQRDVEIVVSSDDEEILAAAGGEGVALHRRPPHLSGPDVPIEAVLKDIRTEARDLFVLLQPTSPFVRLEDIYECIKMASLPTANSACTLTEVWHNDHALNQRYMSENVVAPRISWRYPEEREQSYNKRKKPTNWKFGNCLAVRSGCVRAGYSCFANPCFGIPIDWKWAVDVDDERGLELAEMIRCSISVQN